jgi:uncharacterized protein (DUF697 family)
MSYMTAQEPSTCAKIIHSHAALAAAGNLLPIPGTGFAADTVTMTTMAMALAAVFGANIERRVAEAMAISALKKTMLKQPIKTIAKELSKLIPGLGQIVAPAVSAAMLEAAGWSLAEDMAAQRHYQQFTKAA